MELYRPTLCCIDLDQLAKNMDLLAERLTGQELMAVIKGDAYGHGAVPVMKYLLKHGIRQFAVATLNEALALRRQVEEGELLILGYTPDHLLKTTVEHNVIPTIYSLEQAKILAGSSPEAVIHIKVDTGMNRLGFAITEEAADEVAAIAKLPGVRIGAAFSHLAQLNAESDAMQNERFCRFIELCEKRGVTFPKKHLCNGKSAIIHPEMRYDMVRTGSVLSGFCGALPDLGVAPAMRLMSEVIHVHTVPAGEGVGYDLLDPADHDRQIATLPFGYADGLPRALVHGGWVGIHGKKAPFVGNLCMDMCMVDVTDIEGVQVGDCVDIYGGDGMTYQNARDLSGLGISNLQLQISRRVPRIYFSKGKVVAYTDNTQHAVAEFPNGKGLFESDILV